MDSTRTAAQGARVGLAAATVVVALMFALRLWLDLRALPDIAADAMTLILPGGVFGYLIDRLQEFGRPLMLVGLSLGLLVIGALAGALSVGRISRWPAPLRVAAIAAGCTALTVPAVFIGAADELSQAVVPALTTIGYWTLFGLLLEAGQAPGAERPLVPAAPSPSRRALLYGAGSLGALWLASYLGGRLQRAAALGGTRPVAQATAPPTLPPETPVPAGATPGPPADPYAGLTGITTTKDFYVISKNGVDDPNVNPATWRLQVGGQRPYAIGYDELRALPTTSGPRTLECISNIVGGSLISTAVFTGVPLRVLLERAGVPDGAREIRFSSADGYSESIGLDVALDPSTLVVYQINGEPLPKEHGFPARVLMSGRFGVKNPKWLTQIAPVPGPFNGYWPQRGWNKEAVVLTFSRLDFPQEPDRVPAGKAYPLVRGVAYAGSRGISKVELSFDGGRTWNETRLRKILPADNWMPFTYVWTPPAPGVYPVVVRATDGAGTLQDPAERDSFPDGATGYHMVKITVV